MRMKDIAALRKEYTKASLDITTVNKDPFLQFEGWFKEAVQSAVNEPNAMNLATINPSGRPSSRIVLLKGLEERKFHFYSNYQSQKGKDLDFNPACALTFFWPELERQIRIEGVADRVSGEKSEAYFKTRPRGSQIGAWASPQSSLIDDRKLLDERVKQIEERFKGADPLPKPHQWGGYQVDPFIIEFWQGRPNRLHDRIQFTRIEGIWKIHRLAP